MRTRYAVEFRSGSYLGISANTSGPLSRARLFDSADQAAHWCDRFASWVWVDGGMIVAVKSDS